MRFIQGDTLADAIAKFHGPAAAADAKKSASEIILDAFTGPPAPRFDSLEFRQLLSRFVAVCNAIAFAHSKGIIHRDLKPANVMLGPFGETLVVDWGLAKDLASGDRETPDSSSTEGLTADDSATQTGAILGTPSFMSPEQAAGQPIDPGADVYGLGAILYALLTGVAPVRGDDALYVLNRVRRGDVPPPRTVKPAVPRPLDAACRKAMAPLPADRYESALRSPPTSSAGWPTSRSRPTARRFGSGYGAGPAPPHGRRRRRRPVSHGRHRAGSGDDTY